MTKQGVSPSGVESPFADEEIIVSKTDSKGRIVYANDVFLRVSRFTLRDVLGAPHSIIRHPDMPRCVFRLLWETIGRGEEMFAYVLNMASNGDHYWVFAHVTPSRNAAGEVVGYHSNRRKPEPGQVAKASVLYGDLLGVERSCADRKAGLERSYAALMETVLAKECDYDRFVFSL